MFKILLLYLLIVNGIGFRLMYLDKGKAKKGQWRIPERALWNAAILGGATGCWVGMKLFHHKTRHLQFKYGFPLLAIIDIILICFFRFSLRH